MNARTVTRPLVLGLILLAAHPAIPAAQGFKSLFGGTEEVTLNRRRPPTVYLLGTAITVEVSALSHDGQPIVDRLRTTLETQLTKQDPRLKPVTTKPESIISCSITGLETTERTTTRNVTEHRQTGTTTVWNPKKNANETQPVYQDVPVTHTYKVMGGTVHVTYKVTDDHTHEVLDSNNIDGTFSQEYENGNGAPTANGVQDILVQRVLNAIVPRLAPTIEPLKVLLAKDGRMDDSNKLAEAGLWSKALEDLSEMAPYRQPKDDAYRLYNIGVANEAMAYQTDDLATAQTLLEQASIQYSKSLEMNPSEKYLRIPQTRIDAAMTDYKRLADQKASYERSKTTLAEVAAPKAPEPPGAKTLTPDSSVFTNGDVIALVQGGLDEDNIIATIKTEKTVNFDLSVAALKSLLAAKVSNRVITAMRARQAPVPAAKSPARGAAPPRKPAGAAPGNATPAAGAHTP